MGLDLIGLDVSCERPDWIWLLKIDQCQTLPYVLCSLWMLEVT